MIKMPRTYVKKKLRKYTDEQLENALLRVRNGQETYYQVSKKTGIPKETLRYNLKNSVKRRGSGCLPILSESDEKTVVTAAKSLAEMGFPMDNSDLKLFVQSYLNNKGVTITKWRANKPGKEWVRNFKRRHRKEIAVRKPELLTKQRAAGLSTETVKEFFALYEKVIVENNLQDSPECIFNIDETALNTDMRSSKVLVRKQSKTAYLKSSGEGKTCFTVLFCCNAAGDFRLPVIVYKCAGSGVMNTWAEGGPTDCLYAFSESGWMMDTIFENWLQHFIQTIDTTKPNVLILDGHNSHITYRASQICKDNNIILLCLPPKTSHALQPLDVGVFKPLKNKWREVLKTWARESRHQNVTKEVFPKLLKRLTDNMIASWAEGGFRGSGLYPINAEIVKCKCVDYINDDTDNENVIAIQTAVKAVIFPDPSTETSQIMTQSKKRRKRVQMKTGEVLSSPQSLQRLQQEEKARNEKRKATSKVVRKTNSVTSTLSVGNRKSTMKVQKKNAANQKHHENEGMSGSKNADATNKMKGITVVKPEQLKVDNFVVIMYKERKYLGQITQIDDASFLLVSCLTHVTSSCNPGGLFSFPTTPDIIQVAVKDIFGVVKPPVPKHRGTFLFEVNAHLW